ncbi:MAG TPA: prepilin-type N-terminal cleavage/methylation domain-containing protein [Gammaproteobacteria bacterium]|nr:prepilin-type N-terminal cleavage/methylation domain-containing protein [Gammaproteobacteria bacterium]
MMKQQKQHSRRHQQGLTLVEIMIAVALSVIMLTGVIEVFSSSKQTYRLQDNLARVQENGRFALDYLSRDIRMAGYAGCTTYGTVTNTLNNSADLLYNFTVGVEGYDDVGTPPSYLSVAGIAPLAGTDVVIIRRANDDPVRVTRNNNSAQLFAEVTGIEANGCTDSAGNVTDKVSGICQTDILMVSDCIKSRIFQAGNIQVTGNNGNQELNITHPAAGTPGNAVSSWGGASAPVNEQFNEDAEIVRIGTYAYYVAPGLSGSPSLFRMADGNAMELVEGVENLQVRYGEDTDGDRTADIYQDAGAVTDWSKVVSVRLHLLLRTDEDGLATSPPTYTFNGNSITAADRRLRREFTTTVTLRNRAS